MNAQALQAETCDFCSAPLADRHGHVLNIETRTVECSCSPCSILFSSQASGKYKNIPADVRRLTTFRMTDEQWEELLIPIGIAFFYRSSRKAGVVALYPSPAGPVESELDLPAWKKIEEENPVLSEMVADVEGLLIDRTGGRQEYFRIPIDECFRLVGIVRLHWRGFSGGPEVREHIAAFIRSLQERSQ